MLSRWNDILINANWTDKKEGFFRVWVNGKLSYKYLALTKSSKGKKVYQKFGVYRSFMSYKMAKNVDLVPGQVYILMK